MKPNRRQFLAGAAFLGTGLGGTALGAGPAAADVGRGGSAARAVLVASPVACGRLVAIDSSAARRLPGVLAVLRVRGRSMIDALIDDGDFVIVQPQATAQDGDIVVALLEDNGVTLKRFFREDGRIRLQPANAELEPIYATDLQIQGKVVGVIRKL